MSSRISEEKSLYDILPQGAEGGKEFARIINLLLFHKSRREGKVVNIFNDAAGDYYGLDCFDTNLKKNKTIVGYQYKFYPSPLSKEHRAEIERALEKAIEYKSVTKINNWTLITPKDFIESSTRSDGGDVSWFEGLRNKYNTKMQLEHWGHTTLISLFIETPSICLFYYPGLIGDGNNRKKTINEIRYSYNQNLLSLYENIQFVGLSSYKQEATRGIPMDNIYIPLSVTSINSDGKNVKEYPKNPLELIKQNEKYVILGDPGSGKSTLLRFLALSGISAALQNKYCAKPDIRLPILITLRRYADELRTRSNLSIVDFMVESIQADFSLKYADISFFEYYFESGQTLFLFDGLDELYNPSLKQIVKDRIIALTNTYPGNTVIITSRIVGYEAPFKFDEKIFLHYKIAMLQLPEIEKFVVDWYCARINNEKERKDNIDDLLRILKDDNYLAIQELAQNPILLAIIVLVHRIDAVLPNERAILYQKCIETLLNTWETWKNRNLDIRKRIKTDSHNLRRIEAIAFWMHNRNASTDKNHQIIVSYRELCEFLTNYIRENESSINEEPNELADEFIDFVRSRAGLLIEIGEERYCFVHLTFQEYLTAMYIITCSEKEGMSKCWGIIRDHISDPAWHEVIRLLLSCIKTYESQELLIDNILDSCSRKGYYVTDTLLLGGLLIDDVEAIGAYCEEILRQLIKSASTIEDPNIYKQIISMLEKWLNKSYMNQDIILSAFENLWVDQNIKEEKLKYLLIFFVLGLQEANIKHILKEFSDSFDKSSALYNLFLNKEIGNLDVALIQTEVQLLKLTSAYLINNYFSKGVYVAILLQAIIQPIDVKIENAKKFFDMQIISLCKSECIPSFIFLNSLLFSIAVTYDIPIALNVSTALKCIEALQKGLSDEWINIASVNRTTNYNASLPIYQSSANEKIILQINNIMKHGIESNIIQMINKKYISYDRKHEISSQLRDCIYNTTNRNSIINSQETDFTIDLLCEIFQLNPKAQWKDALRFSKMDIISQRLESFTRDYFDEINTSIQAEKVDITKSYSYSLVLLLDTWLNILLYHDSSNNTIFSKLIELISNIDEPPICIARCIRELGYGNLSKWRELKDMIESNDVRLSIIFKSNYWI